MKTHSGHSPSSNSGLRRSGLSRTSVPKAQRARGDARQMWTLIRRRLGKSYTDRMATIGWTDAARRAGARLARTATSTAIAGPTT